MKTVTNENGLSLEIVTHYVQVDGEDYSPMLGGDDSNPSWEEYLNDYKEEFKPHILLLKKSIEENDLVGYTGQDADDLYFKFSDGNVMGFSWRGWGDLMQAIVNKNEGYMAYYI
jgi:hypothetical protein